MSDPSPPVLAGRRFGVYHLQGLLGAGGMGEVYRAHDARLGRDVAIKILPQAFTADPDRLARFEREARVLASLNHPNIGAIYGLEDADGLRGLVLELIEGETLADRIRRPEGLRLPGDGSGRPSGLPIEEVLAIARQIADALDAAHERGIVHRDLKPANIKITPDGVVKVLDFGLAKAATGDGSSPDLTHSPTITVAGTRDGVILGTAAYMSPEQARGKPVDKRTDVWAFGCVLYEMLTGRAAFGGETISDTIAAILEREPEWRALPVMTPPGIRRLLQRCLEKDLKRRLRDIGDACADIKDAVAGSLPVTREALPSARATRGRTLSWALLSAATGIGATILVVTALPNLRATTDVVPAFDRIVRLVSTPANEFGPAMSPDGKWVAYLSNARGPTDVWVKFVAGGDPANLTASTDIIVQSQDYISGVAISPDGTQIAFSATRAGQPGTAQTTWVVPAPLGGVPRPFLKGGDQGLHWSPDGTRIAYTRTGGSAGDGLVIADADGQNEREIVTRQGGRHIHWIRWSHDGRYVYFDYGIQNFNTEPTEIFRVLATGGAIEPIVRTARRAAYPFPGSDGRGLFYAANPDSVDLSLWWRDFRTGRDHRLTTGVGEYGAPYVSADGQRLVATAVDARQTLMRVPVATNSPIELEPLTDGFTGDFDPSWSPDRSRLVFSSSRNGNRNVWSMPADFSEATPLTSGTTFDERPVVSPDGRQVAFVSGRGGRRGIWTVDVDGGTPRPVVSADVLDTISWSPDGQRLVYAIPGTDAPGLVTVSLADGRTRPLPTPRAANAPAWSPREDVIAYLEPRGGALGTVVKFVSAAGRPLHTEMPDMPDQFGNGLVSWSADGHWLAVAGLPGARAGYIWIFEPGGRTPPRKLIDLPAGAFLRGMTWNGDASSLIAGLVRWSSDIVLAERSPGQSSE